MATGRRPDSDSLASARGDGGRGKDSASRPRPGPDRGFLLSGAARDDAEWEPPSEAELKVIQARRERQDKISKLMSEYLLKGYRMLGDCCEECGTILLQDKQKKLYCVACQELNSYVDKDNPAAASWRARRGGADKGWRVAASPRLEQAGEPDPRGESASERSPSAAAAAARSRASPSAPLHRWPAGRAGAPALVAGCRGRPGRGHDRLAALAGGAPGRPGLRPGGAAPAAQGAERHPQLQRRLVARDPEGLQQEVAHPGRPAPGPGRRRRRRRRGEAAAARQARQPGLGAGRAAQGDGGASAAGHVPPLPALVFVRVHSGIQKPLPRPVVLAPLGREPGCRKRLLGRGGRFRLGPGESGRAAGSRSGSAAALPAASKLPGPMAEGFFPHCDLSRAFFPTWRTTSGKTSWNLRGGKCVTVYNVFCCAGTSQPFSSFPLSSWASSYPVPHEKSTGFILLLFRRERWFHRKQVALPACQALRSGQPRWRHQLEAPLSEFSPLRDCL